MNKGKFIVFEGLDGAGTTTQLKLLAENLRQNNVSVFVTAEPVNESPTGKLIRSILRGEQTVTPETLALLYVADRNEHLYGKNGVMEHINNGETVICDRYLYSSIAYQSVNCNEKFISDINNNFLDADMIIYVDTPVDECLNRINKRGETKEIFEKKSYLDKVKANYDKLFTMKSWHRNVVTIDGRDTPEKISAKIFEEVRKLTDEKSSFRRHRKTVLNLRSDNR